jgi:hypothetical protein
MLSDDINKMYGPVRLFPFDTQTKFWGEDLAAQPLFYVLYSWER